MSAAAGNASASTTGHMVLHLQGTGQHCRDVGNEVESITVVNSIGTATYTSSHPLWPVIRGNFGLMGIVSDITFRMDSNFETPYGEGAALPSCNCIRCLCCGAHSTFRESCMKLQETAAHI